MSLPSERLARAKPALESGKCFGGAIRDEWGRYVNRRLLDKVRAPGVHAERCLPR